MTHTIVLGGLDGTNPLGFFAALGILAVADAAAPGSRLTWRNEGRWRPALSTALDRDALISAAQEDLRTWADDPAIALSYKKVEKEKDSAKKKASEAKVAQDLKPTPERFRQYLAQLLVGSRDEREFLRGRRRPLDYAAAFGTEIARDGSGNVKPTALHFTAGQQEFLKSILALVDHDSGVNADDLTEALFGPWLYRRALPVLSWDSSVARDYALRADDPSKSKKTGVPGADWLAFRGLAFVPVVPDGDEILTASCSGGWKSGGAFTWALWRGGLGVGAVRSLMTIDRLDRLSAHERRARGVELVLRSGIRRSDQGGYGSFMPAEVRPPA